MTEQIDQETDDAIEQLRMTIALHRDEAHPDYLYDSTASDSGLKYPNDGNDHWEHNRDRAHQGREFMGTYEAIYWRRRKNAPPVRAFWKRFPNTISQLREASGFRHRPDVDGPELPDASGYAANDQTIDTGRDRS